MIQFKAEGQVIRRNPDFEMEDRLLLDRIDYDKKTVRIDGKDYAMTECDFPTVMQEDPYAFTAEEETGRGVDHFDIQGFGAHYAYTVDGGRLGDISAETFNAASASLTAHGRSVHPGEGYGRLINALQLLMDLHDKLPHNERPENTRDREGFFHLTDMSGDVETAKSEYIIRDHDEKLFEQKKTLFVNAVDEINKRYGMEVLSLEMNDQYYNMKSRLDLHPEVMEKALLANRISYYIRWDDGGFFRARKKKCVFHVNSAQKETAMLALEGIGGEIMEKVKLL